MCEDRRYYEWKYEHGSFPVQPEPISQIANAINKHNPHATRYALCRTYYARRNSTETVWSLEDLEDRRESEIDDTNATEELNQSLNDSVESIQGLTSTLQKAASRLTQSLNDTTDTIQGLSTTLQKAASSVADISQLPTTQYGLGPITPPDILTTSNIYSAVNEIENNLDGALKSFDTDSGRKVEVQSKDKAEAAMKKYFTEYVTESERKLDKREVKKHKRVAKRRA